MHKQPPGPYQLLHMPACLHCALLPVPQAPTAASASASCRGARIRLSCRWGCRCCWFRRQILCPSFFQSPLSAHARAHAGCPPWARAGSSWSARCPTTCAPSGRWASNQPILVVHVSQARLVVRIVHALHGSCGLRSAFRCSFFLHCAPLPQPAVYKFATPLQHSGFENFSVKFEWGEPLLRLRAGSRTVCCDEAQAGAAQPRVDMAPSSSSLCLPCPARLPPPAQPPTPRT